MKLKTITMIAAITQLLAVLCSFVIFIRSLIGTVAGHMEWKYNWMYLLTQPLYLLAGIALTVFLFTLAIKQNNN
ncbi:MAG TPA: hypothetical protein VKJ65_06620 [Phycisphaerae bacterium]|nr:hypothetical protein [Phycisphaerae bacterium]